MHSSEPRSTIDDIDGLARSRASEGISNEPDCSLILLGSRKYEDDEDDEDDEEVFVFGSAIH